MSEKCNTSTYVTSPWQKSACKYGRPRDQLDYSRLLRTNSSGIEPLDDDTIEHVIIGTREYAGKDEYEDVTNCQNQVLTVETNQDLPQ